MIISSQLPRLEDINRCQCIREVMSIIKDTSHPGHNMFTTMLSGKCYRTLFACTSILKSSFYLRAVIKIYTQQQPVLPTQTLPPHYHCAHTHSPQTTIHNIM